MAIDSMGIQSAPLLICSTEGGFLTMAQSASKNGPKLQVGDFVGWQAMRFNRELSAVTQDERFGWIGLILGTLRPEFQTNIGWIGAELFR